MIESSENLEFERAAVLRDQIQAIERVHEGQKVLQLSNENVDVIALAQEGRDAWVEVFFIRQGKLVGRENFLMHRSEGDEPAEVMAAFVKQFYSANPYVPRRVLLQHLPEDFEAINLWLRAKRQAAVYSCTFPSGERRRSLWTWSRRMPPRVLNQLTIRVRRLHESTNNATRPLEELQEALNLPRAPSPGSNATTSPISKGTNSVGSMVVFEDGRAQEFGALSQVPDQVE